MDLIDFDRKARSTGKWLCGVDEAGRGPIAGPVTAAAVIFEEGQENELIRDSKKMTEKQREAAYEWIIQNARAYAIQSVGVQQIKEKNILGATLQAMEQAVGQLSIQPDLVLIDGSVAPSGILNGRAVVDGDAKSFSIAAASILAKVTRDRIMVKWDKVFPGYGWKKNRGYGTAEHLKAINNLWPTPLHRSDFAPVRDFQYPASPTKQQIGFWGENQAAYYMIRKGARFIDRNIHVGKWGEIDILLKMGELYIVAEVKTRGPRDRYDPMEWYTKRKINHILDATEHWFRIAGIAEYEVRIDAIVVYADQWRKARIEHFEDIVH
ncbi:MAG TPA: ribonuclease HII [Candidatus Marinimicrobia bacterium]|nr:ribonuclease HII [Candidatus Neomarinimicrobiota bacterium]